ncbi:MAG: ABC transporter permease subunit, partial [Treponema sp.]|nr:ABC transporter permease subunit [Treponema sp.]
MKNPAGRLPLSPLSSKIKAAALTLGVIVAFTGSTRILKLDMAKFLTRLKNAGPVLKRFAVADFSVAGTAALEMLASLAIALAALSIGFVLSLALAFLAAENTAPSKTLSAFIKGATAVVRAVPALVWMLMIVASIGFGNTAGLFGLLFPTCGYLIKSFASSIEERGTGTIEALRATGANWFSIVLKGVLPMVFAPVMTWTAMRMEFNIAESINLGMVGVSGIGAYLMRVLGKYDYGAVSTIVIVILAVMLAMEAAVNRLR